MLIESDVSIILIFTILFTLTVGLITHIIPAMGMVTDIIHPSHLGGTWVTGMATGILITVTVMATHIMDITTIMVIMHLTTGVILTMGEVHHTMDILQIQKAMSMEREDRQEQVLSEIMEVDLQTRYLLEIILQLEIKVPAPQA